MPDQLPIKFDDLLRQRTVESERIEYKAGWNPDAILRYRFTHPSFPIRPTGMLDKISKDAWRKRKREG